MARRISLVGRLEPPGDKSLSHRALLFAAIAGGRVELSRLNPGEDVASTARALGTLGVRARRVGVRWIVDGHGADSFRAPRRAIDCGNSGTTMRLLAGVVAACPFRTTLVGDASLSRRPMIRVARPLRKMGAVVEGKKKPRSDELFAPLVIRGGTLRAIRWVSEVASAQVKSAVLLAGLVAGVRVEVTEPEKSRDHTERMMKALGARVKRRGRSASFEPGGVLRAPSGLVPGDPSAAAFFAAAAAALPGSDLFLDDVLLNPTRLGFFRLLHRIGGRVDIRRVRTWCGEHSGTIRVRPGRLRAFRLKARDIPALVDEIPVLAVLAAGACRGKSIITGAAELRVKESDRIAALAKGLSALGGAVRELPDGLEIEGGRLVGGRVDAEGDHRLAMAWRIAGLLADGRVVVSGASSARVSHPSFSRDLARLVAGGAR